MRYAVLYGVAFLFALSVNKFLNLKKCDRLPRLTSLSALLTVNQCRYAVPLRYAIKAVLGISIFPFFPCPARTKGISFLAISCLMVNSFSPRISCVHSLNYIIITQIFQYLTANLSILKKALRLFRRWLTRQAICLIKYRLGQPRRYS